MFPDSAVKIFRIHFGIAEVAIGMAVSSASHDLWNRPRAQKPAVAKDSAIVEAELSQTLATDVFRAECPAVESGENSELVAGDFPSIGTVFLGFRLIGELGRGAFARVYLAEQDALAGRLVALKVTVADDDEPRLLAQLQHTNIVPIYSIHRADGYQAVCMPYFGSSTLDDVLRSIEESGGRPKSGLDFLSTRHQRRSRTASGTNRTGDSPAYSPSKSQIIPQAALDIAAKLQSLSYVDAALWIASQLADGLAHAHARGIVHRDLKPANVLITDEGQPMLLDFNVSEAAHGISAKRLRFGGTLPYMAPEHFRAFRDGAGTVDARSDIYSLGLILFELLTGRSADPMPQGTFKNVFAQILLQRERVLSGPRSINAEIGPAADAIVRKCLEPDPARRYRTTLDLREDLERHLKHLPLRFAGNPSLRERVGKWAKRHPKLSSTAAVGTLSTLLLIGVAVAGYGWRENLRGLEAGQQYAEFRSEMNDLRVELHRTDLDGDALDGNIQRCEALAARYRLLEDGEWANQNSVSYLPVQQREQLRGDAGELFYLYARATGDKARRESDPTVGRRLGERALELSRRAEVEAGASLAHSSAVQQARILERLGDAGQSKTLRDRASATPADSARDCYLLGQEFASQGDYAAALSALDRSTRLDPESFPAWFIRGNCQHILGRYDRAAECYSVCIALRKTHPRAWHNRGLVRLAQGHPAEAVADFDESLRLDPSNADGYLDRGLAKHGSGEERGALADLDRAIEHGNTRTRVYFARALVRLKLGDIEGAAHDRREGLERRPQDELSWLCRAEARLPKEPQEAERDVDEALRLNPLSKPGLQLKAGLLIERGELQAAVALLNRAVDYYPEYAPFRAGRGVIAARQGHRDAALSDAKAALLHDASPSNAYQVAGIYALTSQIHPEDRRDCFLLLRRALQAGFGLQYADADPDLEPVRKTQEYRDLLTEAKAASRR